MKHVVVLILVAQGWGFAAEAILSLPPHPPRLVRSPAYRPDVCRELCREFEADRRGHGFDLCNSPLQSYCASGYLIDRPYCDYLYWSVTEEGTRGILYSVNGTDLSDEERESPVFCDQADQILYLPFMVYANTSTAPVWSSRSMEDEQIDEE